MNTLQSLLRPEALGWAAALLTMLTFISADMRRLRLLALVANAAFITYGSMAHLPPVIALHLALVPVNLWRLNQAFRRGASTGSMVPLPPVMALPLALAPVNLRRLNQAFRRGAPTPPAQHAPAQRAARPPSGWIRGRRAARVSHRRAGSAMPSQRSESDASTAATTVRDDSAPCET